MAPQDPDELRIVLVSSVMLTVPRLPPWPSRRRDFTSSFSDHQLAERLLLRRVGRAHRDG